VASDSAKEITGFKITSTSPESVGVITGTVIAVTVPYGTSVTSLSPVITHTGESISPASGVPQNFTTFVPYIVTAADGSTVTYTVTVTVASVLNSVAAWIEAAVAEDPTVGSDADHAISLPLGIDLDSAQWADILSAIAAKSKYVALDLTDCTAGTHSSGGGLYSSGTFDPGTENSGEQYVTALILPDDATSIVAGTIWSSAFQYFTVLKSAGGAGITDIGEAAFGYRTALTSVDFPLVTSIGPDAFNGCTNLTSVDLPAATGIGQSAFSYTALTSVDLPAAETIDAGAFSGCTDLTSVNLPAATGIGNSAFYDCTGLTAVNLPLAASIGPDAFYGCTDLTSVDLPAATGIGGYAFYGCTDLTSVNFPLAVSIGAYAFRYTALTSVDLPAAETIGNAAFNSCTALISVDLPLATSIGSSAFSFCTALTTVTIGSGCNIDAASGLPNGFKTRYDGNSQAAGTYSWNGTTWDFTTP
jgi:hypothetical protein